MRIVRRFHLLVGLRRFVGEAVRRPALAALLTVPRDRCAARRAVTAPSSARPNAPSPTCSVLLQRRGGRRCSQRARRIGRRPRSKRATSKTASPVVKARSADGWSGGDSVACTNGSASATALTRPPSTSRSSARARDHTAPTRSRGTLMKSIAAMTPDGGNHLTFAPNQSMTPTVSRTSGSLEMTAVRRSTDASATTWKAAASGAYRASRDRPAPTARRARR